MWAGLHVQAQSAQGMGAQKRGAAPLLGSGKARGVGVRRFGAALGVADQHRQGASARLSSAFARRPQRVALIVVYITASILYRVPGYFFENMKRKVRKGRGSFSIEFTGTCF
jgi:hypothetical protein